MKEFRKTQKKKKKWWIHNHLLPIRILGWKWKWGDTEQRWKWGEPWVGHRHYGERSGAKWGWITPQQPVPPYYPPSYPTFTPSLPPPPRPPHPPPHPPLCGVTPPGCTTMTPSPALTGWMGTEREKDREKEREQGRRGHSSRGGSLQSLCIFNGCTVEWGGLLWVSIANESTILISREL